MTFPPLSRTTGLLLAAGAGRRYGHPKALLEDDRGPWVVRAARDLLEGGCADVLVVTGAEGERVESLVSQVGPAVTTTRCGTWDRGMGESLRAGLTSLGTRGRAVPVAALVHLVDLPDVGPRVMARVLGAAVDGPPPGGETAVLARAVYLGRPGHPVLLGRAHWQPVLAGVHGDAGARAYLRRAAPVRVECGDLATGADVDEPVGRPGG